MPHQEKEDFNNAITSTTMITKQSKEERKAILLQTAQAVAGNTASQKDKVVRVLFVSGSQGTYITEYICTNLGLNSI